MRPLITLTTDFGVSSAYVAQMKGAILSLQRDVDLVDITHGIAPQQVVEGAIVLDDVCRRFPPGTIHVAVVDPGVGTSRRIVYAECGGQRYLAPDNGLLMLVVRRAAPVLLVEVNERRYWAERVSDTFHGRDIFAPVAAHLSRGVKPQQLGRPLDRIVELKLPEPQFAVDHIVGHVLLADSVGNLITNIAREQVERLGGPETLCVQYKEWLIEPVGRTYGEHAPGEPAALFDSQGRLEIAVAGGSAAQMLGGALGTSVVVRGRST